RIGSKRRAQRELYLVHAAADAAVERPGSTGVRVVQPVVERERRNRLTQPSRVAAGHAQRRLLAEARVDRRELDLAPIFVQEVEEVEEVELQREVVSAVRWQRLPQRHVESALGGAAAAVALPDVAALLVAPRRGADRRVE